MSGKEMVKILLGNGWETARVIGSHHILKKKGFAPVSVPVHGNKDLPIGTLKSILKRSKVQL